MRNLRELPLVPFAKRNPEPKREANRTNTTNGGKDKVPLKQSLPFRAKTHEVPVGGSLAPEGCPFLLEGGLSPKRLKVGITGSRWSSGSSSAGGEFVQRFAEAKEI